MAGRAGDADYKGVFAHLIYILSDDFAKIFSRPSEKATKAKSMESGPQKIVHFLITIVFLRFKFSYILLSFQGLLLSLFPCDFEESPFLDLTSRFIIDRCRAIRMRQHA